VTGRKTDEQNGERSQGYPSSKEGKSPRPKRDQQSCGQKKESRGEKASLVNYSRIIEREERTINLERAKK